MCPVAQKKNNFLGALKIGHFFMVTKVLVDVDLCGQLSLNIDQEVLHKTLSEFDLDTYDDTLSSGSSKEVQLGSRNSSRTLLYHTFTTCAEQLSTVRRSFRPFYLMVSSSCSSHCVNNSRVIHALVLAR